MKKAIIFIAASGLCPGVVSAQTLAEFDAILMAEDLSILRSEQQVNIAASRVDQARAQLLPQVGISLSSSQIERTQFGLTERYEGEDYSLVVRQPIFDRPSFLEVDRQEIVKAAQDASRDRVAQERRLELFQNFVRWVDAESQVRALTRRLDSVNQRVIQLDELYSAKRVSIVELLTVKNERERVRSELAQAQSNESVSRSLLVSLLGDRVLPERAPAVRAVGAWPFGVWIDGLVADALEGHPLVREAISQRDAARIGVDQADSAWLPTLGAELAFRDTNIGTNDTETFPVETTNARVTLTWDLFDSGGRAAREREAMSRLQDAQFAFDQTTREVRRLQSASASEVHRIQQAWEAARAELESANRLVEAADRSFALGVGTVADTLQALDRVVEAEIRLTTRWLEGVIATAQLAQSVNRLDRALIDSVSAEFTD